MTSLKELGSRYIKPVQKTVLPVAFSAAFIACGGKGSVQQQETPPRPTQGTETQIRADIIQLYPEIVSLFPQQSFEIVTDHASIAVYNFSPNAVLNTNSIGATYAFFDQYSSQGGKGNFLETSYAIETSKSKQVLFIVPSSTPSGQFGNDIVRITEDASIARVVIPTYIQVDQKDSAERTVKRALNAAVCKAMMTITSPNASIAEDVEGVICLSYAAALEHRARGGYPQYINEAERQAIVSRSNSYRYASFDRASFDKLPVISSTITLR